MLTENLYPHEDYQFVEIRIFPSSTARTYTAELSVHGGPVFQKPLELDRERFTELDADPKAYGLALGKELFADNVLGNAYREAFAVAHGKLRVRLRLDASDLQAIHWERIYYPLNGSWHALGDSADTPFSRFVPVPSWKSPRLIAERPLKVLVVIASPANLNSYALEPIADAERKALHMILQVFADESLTCLETGTSQRPTLSQLREILADGYHLIHVLCHGALIDGGTVLYLEDEHGNAAPVTTDILVDLFNDQMAPPLFCFLAACKSAMQRDSATFTPLGPALVQRSNIQAVVAMTGQVGVETARFFTAQFYTRLLQHGVVDVAVNEARALVQDEWDWGVPVLFMRLEDGRLFKNSQLFTFQKIERPPSSVTMTDQDRKVVEVNDYKDELTRIQHTLEQACITNLTKKEPTYQDECDVVTDLLRDLKEILQELHKASDVYSDSLTFPLNYAHHQVTNLQSSIQDFCDICPNSEKYHAGEAYDKARNEIRRKIEILVTRDIDSLLKELK